MMSLIEHLCIGLAQTTLDHKLAWPTGPMLSPAEEARAECEIDRAMHAFGSDDVRPDIVLFPELAAPRHLQKKLQKHADNLSAIIIAGMNYRILGSHNAVRNEAQLYLPKRWLGKLTTAPSASRVIGKTYPAWGEKRKLENAGFQFEADPVVWIFDGGRAGKFAVAICYDFLDLERVALYRSRIHHLFVLAYNRDIRSFEYAAEAAARMLLCNVVVCNTGHHGGSLAVTPYREPYRRTIYRSEGPGLFCAQVIKIPVSSLNSHQKAPVYGDDAEFKAPPAGYVMAKTLKLKTKKLA